MPLQNRVDPFGAIHAVAARGLFTGNRGIIHDPDTQSLLKKRWATKAWILCVCDFGGRRRVPMGRNRPGGKAGWTELFFLDEPTALAAGHRPCFACRRRAAVDFLARFGAATASAAPRAPALDTALHRERLAAGGVAKTLDSAMLLRLPDGAMVSRDGVPFALKAENALPWGFEGYGGRRPRGSLAGPGVRLITPPATVAVLAAGYRPVWHASAGP